MGIIKCPNGHFFDSQKYTSCPYCTPGKKQKFSLFDKTIAKIHNASSDNVTVAYSEDKPQSDDNNDLQEDEQLTISKAVIDGKDSPVSGWLVCVKGNFRGRSYEIRQGKNYIGRDSDMDIALLGEKSVTRHKHMSIVFEPLKSETYAVCENGMIYVNDKPVASNIKLSENDILSIGNLEFLFVPYCNGERKW